MMRMRLGYKTSLQPTHTTYHILTKLTSILKMEATCFPYTLISSYKATHFHNREDYNPKNDAC